MTESAAPTERAEQWWRQLDERVRSIVREEWEIYHSAVVAEALGETIDQIDREHDELRRSIAVLEREIVQVRDQLALREAVDRVSASVNVAAAKMPHLNAAVVWPDPQQQILPKLGNRQIWTGPGLCLLVLVNGSNYPDFLRLLFAMARDVLLAGNATTVPADDSHSCLSAAAVLSADDFSLDSGAD
jgi:hypothetical protein